MRSTGILRSWNDDRGFGFIAPTQGGGELFVHISALSGDGSRPVVGETVSFELGRGKDGKPQAVKVVRSAVGPAQPAARMRRPPDTPSHSGKLPGQVLALCLLGALAMWGYDYYKAESHRRALEAMPRMSAPVQPPATAATSGFRCDGRAHCSQMTSCAEATWFINHCPGTQMDSDHDGVPCEQQWCAAVGTR
ncbi:MULTISPECIES: cold shock domain-containing protein [unclassified Roseateles]|uniref:cold shock domain-containing protein n=1 Tax=unclassified Roseateles TaxID=2626991 RepID=UPI0006FED1C2|nr:MULTISPECIES: cold shock domain-containing protein [unclassified Roseateles]KQW45388.1 hypothetical protein ASC81_10730 [Pelomonas sp. Root405]KRA72232.1 hypothetical protein ASD88_10730 [Pelomonas sp. Root662]